MTERFDESFYELDRALDNYEILDFTEAVVWPAVDHLFGANFRERAGRRKKVRLPRKVFEFAGPINKERLVIEADADPHHLIEDDFGERSSKCNVNISIETARPEMRDGVISVLETENPFPFPGEECEDDDEQWWRDPDIFWQVWEAKSHLFSTDVAHPYSGYFYLEAQDEEERSPTDRFLWGFDDGPALDTRAKNKKIRRVNQRLAGLEEEFARMISLRDCLEIRAALIQIGVPAELMKVG